MTKTITWKDLGFLFMSELDGQRRFFRIDRQAGVSLSPRFSLEWRSQPSPKRHSKQHVLRRQMDLASIADAKELAEQWNEEQ